MAAQLIDGKACARVLRQTVATRVGELGFVPGLATLLVGDDPASAVYVRNKRRQCVETGMRDFHQHLPADLEQTVLEGIIEELNTDPEVHGILLQLPLPPHLDAQAAIARIHPDKDVDGLTEVNAGRLSLGRRGLQPCTPAGVMALLDSIETNLRGARTVVVGRSQLVGRPLAQLLLSRDATVTVCHSKTKELTEHTRQADVLVAAAGVPTLIGFEHVKPGAVVIDVGIHRTATGLRGDVDFDAVRAVAGHLTPVPGGVGPMTIAMLLHNTLTAAERAALPAPAGEAR